MKYFFELDDELLMYATKPKDIEDDQCLGMVHLSVSTVYDKPDQGSLRLGAKQDVNPAEFVLNNGLVDIRLRASS